MGSIQGKCILSNTENSASKRCCDTRCVDGSIVHGSWTVVMTDLLTRCTQLQQYSLALTG